MGGIPMGNPHRESPWGITMGNTHGESPRGIPMGSPSPKMILLAGLRRIHGFVSDAYISKMRERTCDIFTEKLGGIAGRPLAVLCSSKHEVMLCKIDSIRLGYFDNILTFQFIDPLADNTNHISNNTIEKSY